MLEKLIASIDECEINKELIGSINVIIVDNDIERSAETKVNELINRGFEKFRLKYYSYAVKGLANVRNELINRALELLPGYIVFIDDDEYVSVNWLNELIKTITSNNADLTMGPVIGAFEKEMPAYVSTWFERPEHKDGEKLDFIRSGNLAINADSLIKFQTRFDPRFNSTGSEDTYFGTQLMKKGATIYWAADAIAYETIPSSRANINWLLKRKFRVANTFTYMLKLEKQYPKVLKKALVSIFYIVLGVCACVLVVLPIEKRYWGPLKIAEGMGGFSGLINFSYSEYN